MRAISLVFAAVLALLGCSVKNREVDLAKSCNALLYESESLDFQLSRDRGLAESARKEGVLPFHMFVVSLGAMASAASAVSPPGTALAFEGASVYVLPALTVGYYNKFIAPKEIIDRYDYLENRRAILDKLLEEKSCKKAI
ncbi:MAG: hypothetical protein LBU73_01470 [Helicobacteraceae bacterium]|nr:hypothetical protein [Helicobacteraceae bacterium]